MEERVLKRWDENAMAPVPRIRRNRGGASGSFPASAHGFQHAPLRPRHRTPARLLARASGRRAGEFTGLDGAETRRAVQAGWRVLKLAGLEPDGFVAPGYAYTGALRRTLGRLAIPAHGLIPPGLLGYVASGADSRASSPRGASDNEVEKTVSRGPSGWRPRMSGGFNDQVRCNNDRHRSSAVEQRRSGIGSGSAAADRSAVRHHDSQ
jgi:hypothetical protein